MKAHGFSYNEIAKRNGWSWTKVNRCISEGRASFMETFKSIETGKQCEQLAPLLSALVDGEVKKDERAAVKLHLRGCAVCRARLREYRSVTTQVAEIMPPLLLGASVSKSFANGNLWSALRAARDAIRSVVVQGTDSIVGRTVAPFTADPSGISTAAKVCTGATCVLIAGGAATVGLQRGHAHRTHSESRAAATGNQDGSIQPPLTSGPAPLPGQPSTETGPSDAASDGQGANEQHYEESVSQSHVESNFEPDSAGAPVEKSAARPQSGTPKPKRSSKQSPTPPTGGSQEFQP